MGRNENIKRMKKMRAEKKRGIQVTSIQLEMDAIAAEATNSLLKKMSPLDIVECNTGPLKYSELLKEFVRPSLNLCRDFNDTKQLFSTGGLAWNVAVLKQTNRNAEYEKMMKDVKKLCTTHIALDFFMELIDRKINYFPQHKGIFRYVELTEAETAFGISVAVGQLD